MTFRTRAAVAGAIALAPVLTANAEPTVAELEARKAFLEDRLTTQRAHADAWWWGWSIFYGIGVVVQGVRATDTDNDADKADRIIGAVQSSGALIRMLAQPHAGIAGPPAHQRASTRADLEAYVASGERALDQNAEATNAFGPWYAHLINLAVNGAAGLFIGLRYDAWDKAALSTGIGIAIGEVNILTAPWEADADRAEYRARFGGRGIVGKRGPEWSLAPSLGGLTLAGRF
ncbi:MAG: hypothetical protein JNK04_23445 [Myxococcales bacterium]|nr:hypothetical protein [Myxococcales bacterium]